MACRIGIVDDHALFREGFRTMLAAIPDMQVVAEASNSEEAIRAIRGSRPEVVVLDVMLPGMDGIHLARELLREDPGRRVLALTMLTDDAHVTDAFKSGVLGYATKRQPAAEVVEAIRRVARGERYLAPELAEGGEAPGFQALPGELQSLTGREREIFQLCVTGMVSREIARQLQISPRTVETHRARILRKLGARSAVDLVRLAARWGLLPA